MAAGLGYYTPESFGFTPPPPPEPGELPPGQGRWAVPHQFAFSSIFMAGHELYRSYFDQALRHSRVNALAMRNDIVIDHALFARKSPTAQLAWHIDPIDETNPAEVEAASGTTRTLEEFPRWQQFVMVLLDALWYGRMGSQMIWRWDYSGGSKKLKVVDHVPVNGDKFRFHWSGQIGMYVHAMYPGDKEASDIGMYHNLTPDERQQLVCHRVEPEDADWTEGEFAGQIHGVGLRSKIYWFWWLKTNIYALMVNYLERFANGLTLISFDASNKEAKKWADSVAQNPWSRLAVTIPNLGLGGPQGQSLNKVERLEVGTAPPSLMLSLVTDYFDKEIRRRILGQDLSSDTAPTGLGSGVAAAHMETLDRIIKYDAVNLQDTIQADLVNVYYRWNYPGVRPGRFKFDVDDPNTEEVYNYMAQLFEWGDEIDLDYAKKIAKIPKPKPGAATASKIAPMQPVAVGQPGPEGVPTAGQPGPVPADGQPMNGQPMIQANGQVMPGEQQATYTRRRGGKTFFVMAG